MAQASSKSIFTLHSPFIRSGDTVIVYQSRENLSAIVVQEGQHLRTKHGEFPHQDMIGLSYGSKCRSRTGHGFTYLLRPTPELWTLALPHRTQILYHPDISFITSYLDIKPGSVVLEAGTGSGSFSHSIARTVGDSGTLFSFEFHEDRHGRAATEFESHGLLSTVGGPIVLAHRDVIKDGFGPLRAPGRTQAVDAVFLDLPAPWDALSHAKKVMNRSRVSRICCFSPCIEQVQKTCETLHSLGFSDIVMFETLLRTHEPIMIPRTKVEDAIIRLKHIEVKKEVRKEKQRSDALKRKNLLVVPSTTTLKSPSITPAGVEASPSLVRENDAMLDDSQQLKSIQSLDPKELLGEKSSAEKPSGQIGADASSSPDPNFSTPSENGTKQQTAESDPAGKDSLTLTIPELNQAGIENISKKRPMFSELHEGNLLSPKRPKVADPVVLEPQTNGDVKVTDGIKKSKPPEEPVRSVPSCKPAGMSRGHTSFLTFAVLLPLPPSSKISHCTDGKDMPSSVVASGEQSSQTTRNVQQGMQDCSMVL